MSDDYPLDQDRSNFLLRTISRSEPSYEDQKLTINKYIFQISFGIILLTFCAAFLGGMVGAAVKGCTTCNYNGNNSY